VNVFSHVGSKFLFTAVVFTVLTIVVLVVGVGGVVCIRDPNYTFSEYLADLSWIYKLLALAVIAAIGNAWVSGKQENGDDEERPVTRRERRG
jgi:hypothetical protein